MGYIEDTDTIQNLENLATMFVCYRKGNLEGIVKAVEYLKSLSKGSPEYERYNDLLQHHANTTLGDLLAKLQTRADELSKLEVDKAIEILKRTAQGPVEKTESGA